MSAQVCRFASDDVEVTVLPELGARVHSIRTYGVEVLRTPDDVEQHRVDPFRWGGYHMVPWCNRIHAGLTTVAGRALDLRSNQADRTAIHGEQYLTAWEHVGGGVFQTVGGGGAWPWTYAAEVTYSVDGPVLRIGYRLTNTSDSPMPAGVGFHPWFRTPSRVRIPAVIGDVDNTRLAPALTAMVGRHDLRRPRPLEVGIDACWVDLDRPVVDLWWDDAELSMTMAADDPGIVAVAARLAGVDAVAVEMQTHMPHGIRRLLAGEPHAIELLAPGAARLLTLTLTFGRAREPVGHQRLARTLGS